MTSRRDFIVTTAGSAIALALPEGAKSSSSRVLTAQEIVHRTARRPKQSWDDRWIRTLRRKHKAVFDAKELGNGAVLTHVALALTSYHDFMEVPDSEVAFLVVLRHHAIVLALNDAMWNKYELGLAFRLRDPAIGTPSQRNPFLNVTNNDAYGVIEPIASILQLQRRGVTLLVCDRAVRATATIADRGRGNFSEVFRDLRANVIPGVIVVPNGIFALVRAQQLGCALIPA
jgi:intracellular sulfur oxidation DsrE/DsrF family protein